MVLALHGIVFEVSEEFFPLCLTRLLRKLSDLGACFKVLSAIIRYRPLEGDRRLMATRSSGDDHGLVYLPILDLPTCVLAAEIKVLLSLRTRSRREIGSSG